MTSPTTDPYLSDISTRRVWPDSHDTRKREWRRRMRAHLGLDYEVDEEKRLGLFAHTNGSGEVVQRTRRIHRVGAFLAARAAAALANGLSLDLTRDAQERLGGPAADVSEGPGAEALKRGMEVWRLSDVEGRSQGWATAHSAVGDTFLEAVVVEPGRAALVHHPMEEVHLYYDRLGRDLEAVYIECEIEDLPDVTATEAPASRKVMYRRWLTRTEVRTRIGDGAWVTRPHPLGVVPGVHVQFNSAGDPHMGLHAAYHIEDAEALLDSQATQMHAVGTIMGNPLLALIGAMMAEGEDAGKIGRVLNLPPGASVQTIEFAFTGLRALVEHGAQVRQRMEQVSSAFLFVDAGASASGLALSYRAGAWKGDIEPVQKRWWRALARGIALCLALQDQRAFVAETDDVFDVRGAPALPEDRRALADLMVLLDEQGLIVLEDALRALQGAGILPADRSIDEYAAQLRAEADRRKASDLDTAERMGLAKPREVPAEAGGNVVDLDAERAQRQAPDAAAVAADPDAAVADTAFNGAQFKALIETLGMVGDGSLTPEAAVLAIQIAAPMADDGTVRRMVQAQRSAEPPAAQPAPTAPQPETA